MVVQERTLTPKWWRRSAWPLMHGKWRYRKGCLCRNQPEPWLKRESKMFKESRESAPVRILLASRNVATIEFLCQQTHCLSMYMETACDLGSAMRKLCQSKFEGLIVDFELGDDGLRLLGRLSGLTSNRRAVSFAIVTDERQAASAFQAPATFVLQRPFDTPVVVRTLRAARPMMFRERRRDYRYPIEVRMLIRAEG